MGRLAGIVADTDRGIAHSSNVHPRVPFQLGASQVAVHCYLPVTLGVLPDVIHGRDVLRSHTQIRQRECQELMPGANTLEAQGAQRLLNCKQSKAVLQLACTSLVDQRNFQASERFSPVRGADYVKVIVDALDQIF